jgi:hypothetical protein
MASRVCSAAMSAWCAAERAEKRAPPAEAAAAIAVAAVSASTHALANGDRSQCVLHVPQSRVRSGQLLRTRLSS